MHDRRESNVGNKRTTPGANRSAAHLSQEKRGVPPATRRNWAILSPRSKGQCPVADSYSDVSTKIIVISISKTISHVSA
jgi:hypothetical protein